MSCPVLSVVQEKLAEAHGLAIASDSVAARLQGLVEDDRLLAALAVVRSEAWTTRRRCLAAGTGYGPEAAEEILAHANTVAERGADLAAGWFKAGTDRLAGWTFLVMGESAEVAAWSALRQLAQRDRSGSLRGLADWALPVQERHLRAALEGVVLLSAEMDPAAPRPG